MARHSGKFRLSKLDLDEISLVAAGDDPMAHVVLSKAAPDEEAKHGLDGNDFRRTDILKYKKHTKIWYKTHPSPLSTPKEITGHHGHSPHGPSIRWPALYEHLRKKGYSKEKAARISNAGWRKKRMGIATNTPTTMRGML